jgi:cysteine synthase
MPSAQRFDNILDAIGNTPLVQLTRMMSESPCEVYAKLEFMNPSGSIKDRVARHMILKAERDGRIHPGDTIIENSSGNMAMSLGLIAIQRGYRLRVVVRDTISKEKLGQLLALGVDVIKADTSLPPEAPDSYNNITPRLAREMQHCYFPDQHNNRENNEAHYVTTGPEIWDQMEGRIDYLVAGIGTGGTIGGVGRYLKERSCGTHRICLRVWATSSLSAASISRSSMISFRYLIARRFTMPAHWPRRRGFWRAGQAARPCGQRSIWPVLSGNLRESSRSSRMVRRAT